MKKTVIISIVICILLSYIIISLWLVCFTSEESNRFLISSILTVIGFLVSVICIILGFKFGLEDDDSRRDRRIKEITKKINLGFFPDSKLIEEYHVRVTNNSLWTIHNCGGYISISNNSDDILSLDEIRDDLSDIRRDVDVFIDYSKGRRIEIEKLSWAEKDNYLFNNHKSDINSGETQDLMIFKFTKNGNLEIASETGFTSDMGVSRCVLKNKEYSITIRIVSDDTVGKDFNFRYDSKLKMLLPI